jgi:ABC-2 type transport system ATP-binding protein
LQDGYAIETEGLGRLYGKNWAIRDLSIGIRQGEVFGVLGPNGAGKTTTMRLLACLVAPTEGRATVCGYDIVRQPTEVRKRVGILTDTAGLYESLPAQTNLEFFAKMYDLSPQEIRRRSDFYLKMLGLWERRGDPVGTFSSGMKQKLSMARALLHEPALLLLDEPTSALDPEGAKLVRDFISQLSGQGRTIVLCTHNLAEAQTLCDRVAIIKRTVLRMGTPKQLQTSLYGRQVEIRIAQARGSSASASGPTTGDRGPGYAVNGHAPIPHLNDLAVLVSSVPGVGDVGVADDRLLVSVDEPERMTPGIVRLLVNEGVDIVRVAEIEHSLERAYLDLVTRSSPNRGSGIGDRGSGTAHRLAGGADPRPPTPDPGDRREPRR